MAQRRHPTPDAIRERVFARLELVKNGQGRLPGGCVLHAKFRTTVASVQENARLYVTCKFPAQDNFINTIHEEQQLTESSYIELLVMIGQVLGLNDGKRGFPLVMISDIESELHIMGMVRWVVCFGVCFVEEPLNT